MEEYGGHQKYGSKYEYRSQKEHGGKLEYRDQLITITYEATLATQLLLCLVIGNPPFPLLTSLPSPFYSLQPLS